MQLQLAYIVLATSVFCVVIICTATFSSYYPPFSKYFQKPDESNASTRATAALDGGRSRTYNTTNSNSAAPQPTRRVRVLVWVMTSPQNALKARTVKSTWGSRADPGLLLFMSSAEDPSLPTVALKAQEGREHLTAKTMQAFDYVYEHYRDKADFFMKADDDTYVIMENLRHFLSHLDPMQPFVTGRKFKPEVKQGFPSGGAGYVLSKAALQRLAGRPKKPALCKEDGLREDVELGLCMERLGIPLINSTDSEGGSRFHPYTPMQHVVAVLPGGYQYFDANVVRVGPDAINDYPISFHYIQPSEMKLIHYYVYRLSVYRLSRRSRRDRAPVPASRGQDHNQTVN